MTECPSSEESAQLEMAPYPRRMNWLLLVRFGYLYDRRNADLWSIDVTMFR